MSSSDSKTKWTPGNWLAAAKPSSIVGWPVVSSPQGRVVASVSFQKIKPPHISEEEMARYRAECEANARLIAASPTMANYIHRKADEGCAEAQKIWEAINASC